jgi:hypothetical protein
MSRSRNLADLLESDGDVKSAHLDNTTSVTVTDNVTSTSTTEALSANQGKALKDLVDGKQADDAQLTDVAGLAVTDGNFIVGNGSNFVAENPATALASLGVTSTAAHLNTLDGVNATLTAAELNYVDGVTSAIQTQINGKESLPALKAANYTASAGDSVIVTAGSITITLPSSPTAGDTVVVKDGTGAASTTNWTVGRNGSNIASSATDLTFDKNWSEIRMTYINASIGWSV